MRTLTHASRRPFNAARTFAAILFLALASVYGSAQTESVRDGSTPSALSAGAPAGSYSLSGFETVNPYNGGLNFSLPLFKVGGRGEAGYAVTLRIDQKWSIVKEIDPGHTANFTPKANWLDEDGFSLEQTYSVGKLTVRNGASRDYYTLSPCGTVSRVTLTRLSFTAPDGTEYELRDRQSNGTPHVVSPTACEPQYSRGNVFVTSDGSSATFIADSEIKDAQFGSGEGIAPTGVMILKNGTRLHVGNMGKVDWMRDRNGNLVTFVYTYNSAGAGVITVTDSLGRQVTITDGSPVVIAYKGFGATDRAVKVYNGQLGTALRSDSQLQTQGALFPGINNPLANSLCNPKVITSVELPNQRTYQFRYNSYGELARVELPTGGAFEYDYAAGLTDGVASGMLTDANNQKQVYRRVVERRVYPSGGAGTAYSVKQVYSRPETGTTNAGSVEVRQCTSGPSAGACGTGTTLLGRELHYYYGSPRLSFNKQPYEYTGWQEGKEYKTETYDPQSGALLRATETKWEQPVDGAAWPLQAAQAETNGAVKPNGPQVTQTLTTLADANQIAGQTFSYDQYGNRTDTYEYDYGAAGSGQPGPFLRRTHTDFVTTFAYVNADVNPASGAGLRGLPRESWVSTDIAGADANKVSRTSYLYDQSAPTDPGVAGHDASYGSAFMTRGNPTGTTRYLNPVAPSGGITTTAAYDVAGNVTSTTDAGGNTSYVSYGDNFSDGNNARNTYAFATTVTTPAPNSGVVNGSPPGTFGSTTGLTSYTSYDFSTGLVTSTTDANSKTTTYDYADPLDRLKRVDRPDGGRTTYTYVDTHQCGAYVEARTLLDSSGRETDSYGFHDGLGRPYLAETYDGQDANNVWLRVDTQYDPMGRASQVSNPYLSPGCGASANPSGRWTTTAYDALGRAKSVTTADGAVVSTDYVGNKVTATDQAGRKRRSASDALGRLTQVTEDPTAGGLNYVTDYTYDALGNLRKIDQGGQVRFFMYDSLSRLIRAKNPEQAAGSSASNVTDPLTGNSQWSTAYGYDDSGNLKTRTDARNVTTYYTYDNLNRNVLTSYSDGTPTVGRVYDKTANGVGRLSWDPSWDATGAGVALGSYSYDVMGRVQSRNQYFWANNNWSTNYSTSYAYDLAGNVTSQSYPSGRTVSYAYDRAGRTTDFVGTLGDGVQRTYSAGVTYGEFGGVSQEQFGTRTPLYHKLHYNVRGQLYDVRLSTQSMQTGEWDWNRGALVNYYTQSDINSPTNAGRYNSGAENNGNVLRTETSLPTDPNGSYSGVTWSGSGYAIRQEHYTYDSLNRITSVIEYSQSTTQTYGPQFAQYYLYDRWGNRTINTPQTWGVPATQFELGPQTNQEVAEPSNRLYAPGDAGRTPSQKLMRYDAAGNLVYDGHTGYGARAYDAENRMTQAQDAYQGWSTYAYDADGRRVRRVSANQETWQVYGAGGELVAEYQAGAAPMVATKEYGYRGGEMLVTMSSGDPQRMTRFVKNLYYNCLARDPNAAELQQKFDQLAQAGVQGEQQLLSAAKAIARGLFESSEYAARNRDNTQYVTDLYNAYLQRAPDAGGLSFWVQDAQNNGRGHTLTSFEVSAEFATLAETVYGTASGGDNQRVDHFIDEFYLGAYGRFPTPAERQQQEQRLNAAAALGPEQVKAGARLMGAEIFQATNYNSTHSDSQYVTELYEAYLQRAPDGPGLSFWLSKVQNEGRASALVGFQNSTEFGELAGTLYREAFWLVNDHLGTPRMVVDKSGTPAGVKRHDYLPFGEELSASLGGRSASQGYTASDNVRQTFTGYERDSETSLDYARARYFSRAQGRFIGADPGPFTPADPQGWNRFSYVQNNPLKFVDPDGEMLILTGPDAEYIVEELEKYTGYELKRDKKTGLVTIDTTVARNDKGTSKRLADKLAEIADRENKVTVKINVASNLDRTYGDAFRDQAIDAADYRTYDRDAPELSAALLGHVLDEYYTAKKYGNKPEDGLPEGVHDHAIFFEADVLSDFIGTEQVWREGSERGENKSGVSTKRYSYQSVTYDIYSKTVRSRPGKMDIQVTGVKRVK